MDCHLICRFQNTVKDKQILATLHPQFFDGLCAVMHVLFALNYCRVSISAVWSAIWCRVWKIPFFGSEKGQDLKALTAHPPQDIG